MSFAVPQFLGHTQVGVAAVCTFVVPCVSVELVLTQHEVLEANEKLDLLIS